MTTVTVNGIDVPIRIKVGPSVHPADGEPYVPVFVYVDIPTPPNGDDGEPLPVAA